MIPPFRTFLASDRLIREILRGSRTIALVGVAQEPTSASHRLFRMLRQHGYRVLPIRPDGGMLPGETTHPDLARLEEPVDVVAVADPACDLDALSAQAVERGARTLWLQPGVGDGAAAYRAHRLGLTVVMNRCMSKEYEAQFPEDELL